MAVLFFLSAFFAAGSFERHGKTAFIRGRLFRLGIPLLVYMFIIYPFIEYYLAEYNTVRSFPTFFDNYINHITSFLWLTSTRTIWFVEVLLLFSLVYAAMRSLHPRKVNPGQYLFKNIHCILLIAVLGISTFLIRLIFPMDKDFLNLHLTSWSYYIIFFVIGVNVGENKCFDVVVDRKNIVWLTAAFSISVPLLIGIMLAGGGTSINGGLNWQSLAYAAWESFFCVSFSLGILTFFKKYFNRENKISRVIAKNTFGIYFFHAPIMVYWAILLRNWQIVPMMKFLILAIITYISSLVFSIIIQRIPLLRSIFK
jgi:surface polysaccharide O-acyltransferase-like enzyme